MRGWMVVRSGEWDGGSGMEEVGIGGDGGDGDGENDVDDDNDDGDVDDENQNNQSQENNRINRFRNLERVMYLNTHNPRALII